MAAGFRSKVSLAREAGCGAVDFNSVLTLGSMFIGVATDFDSRLASECTIGRMAMEETASGTHASGTAN